MVHDAHEWHHHFVVMLPLDGEILEINMTLPIQSVLTP